MLYVLAVLIRLFARFLSLSFASTKFPSWRNGRPNTASAIRAQISNGRLALPTILVGGGGFRNRRWELNSPRQRNVPARWPRSKSGLPDERSFAHRWHQFTQRVRSSPECTSLDKFTAWPRESRDQEVRTTATAAKADDVPPHNHSPFWPGNKDPHADGCLTSSLQVSTSFTCSDLDGHISRWVWGSKTPNNNVSPCSRTYSTRGYGTMIAPITCSYMGHMHCYTMLNY